MSCFSGQTVTSAQAGNFGEDPEERVGVRRPLRLPLERFGFAPDYPAPAGQLVERK